MIKKAADIEQIEIAFMAWGGQFGKGIYEIRYFFKNESKRRVFDSVMVTVSVFKNKGLVRRIDHTKKTNEWLNTQEGKQWFFENYVQKDV